MATPVSQTKGLQRNTIDKYYTNPETVKLCIEYIDKKINYIHLTYYYTYIRTYRVS